jgi:hypothetical protein
MWKRSMVVIGGAALAVSLPTAVFAMATEGGGASVKADAPIAVQTTYQAMYGNTDAIQLQIQDQIQVQDEVQVRDQVEDQAMAQSQIGDREQLRLHIETGAPEGTEPTQTRLRQHQEVRSTISDAPTGNGDAHRGNPDAPMLGDGTGECIYDGVPIGNGPHGPGAGPKG